MEKRDLVSWEMISIELALRPGSRWLAILPANINSLCGWLSSKPYRKRQKEQWLKEAGNNPEDIEAAEILWQEEIRTKAGRILDELTVGSPHRGQDSPIPSDLRFKRTNNGNLYIGAGCLLGAIKDAAFYLSGNPGMRRYLGNRLYISPGKVVIFRYKESGIHVGLKVADGRAETHVPPAFVPGPFGFSRKPATINYPEMVADPAFLCFCLHVHPDLVIGDIRTYIEAAAELGIYGMHSSREGQFEIKRFEPAREAVKARVLAHVLSS